MPSRRVAVAVVSRVVAWSVILASCTHTQSDYSSNSTANTTTIQAPASEPPEILYQDGPVGSTTQTPITEPPEASDGCACNVTPDFCDLGCCCDGVDCGVADLSSVFTDCPQETESAVCIESWLMFRANVDPQLVTDTGSLFCVQRANDPSLDAQTAPAASAASNSILSPHFSSAELGSTRNAKVYKVDDVILTYYNATSIVSTLKQPTPGAASSFCFWRNPARFLRSGSSSCSQVVSAQSCTRDGGLSSSSYFTGFSLLRVPNSAEKNISKIMIPIVLPVNPPEPAERNGSCLNVVSKVEYVITYSSAGEITAAALNINVTSARLGMRLLQQHAVRFQSATPSTSPPKLPLVGLEVGMPVIGWFGGRAGPLTISGRGDCSSDPTHRTPMLFARDTVTGCMLRSDFTDCASLRARIYNILRGTQTPDAVAMTAGSQPPQSRVAVQGCPEPAPGEVCETGCLVPVSLSVKFLWAQRGLLALPQNHILGVKYVFSCQILKCRMVSPFPLTTEVIFAETTVYPEPPRAKPQPEWRFPFGFFSWGTEELDRI